MNAAAQPPAPRRSPTSRATGWILLAVLLAFTAAVHHGVGPEKPESEGHWYAPTHFLFENEATAALLDPPWLGFVTLGGLAVLLAIGVHVATASAVARTLALSAVAATLLFLFYGLAAPFPWEFFGWRGSAVLVLVGLCFGIAAGAPLLAGSWLRWSWPWRIALYLPLALVAVAFVCNATGTDPSLPFAISPWPAVPVFGLEVGALLATIVWLGTATALAGLARAAGRPAGVALAVGAGLAVPLGLLGLGSALGLFPFRAGAGMIGIVAGVCALTTAAAAAPGSLRRARTTARARAHRIAVGAALLAVPLVAGEVLAEIDYYVAREVRARRVIDALDRYYARESLYPDELDALVDAGLLERVPDPSIGVGLGLVDGDGESEGFRYGSFGSSYLLEFTATRWVQCAYTPAPDYEEDERLEEDFDETALEESWSCPSRPPELW